jgi:hypothetical protein
MSLAKQGIEILERPAQPEIVDGGLQTESRVDAFVQAHIDRIVVALAIFSAIRILLFAAAFPLSNNVDERFHLMTIQMYAQGRMPGKDLPHMDPAAARVFSLFWSPEYWHSQEYLNQNGAARPLYGLPPHVQDSELRREFYVNQLQRWLNRPNYEAQSAPFYYAVAAVWYRLGSALGIRDWGLEYWLRLLNPVAYGLLIWLSYRFVRTVYPERTFLCLAVPALIAVFPQDVFFGMNRDVFSAPMCAAALLLMIKAVETRESRDLFLLLASFLAGISFLVNVSNFVLYGALAATLWLWTRQSADSVLRKIQMVSASTVAAGVLPVLWMLRNYIVMGDLTGGKAKTHELTWTVKPLSDMFHHPLFSLQGLYYFLVQLTRSFWRGEYLWHGESMRSVSADRFYVLSSALMIVVFVADFTLRRKMLSKPQRWVGWQVLFLVAGSVLFLAVLSVLFDFHECGYPSRLYPYFVSGRIISGALLPFVLIYAAGLESITTLIRRWIPPVVVLACLMLFITASEIRVRSVAFSSHYNFFALSAGQH